MGLVKGRVAGNQPATAHRHEVRVNRAGGLTHDFQRGRALPGNHQRVVVGRDVTQAAAGRQMMGVLGGFVVAALLVASIAATATLLNSGGSATNTPTSARLITVSPTAPPGRP